MASYAPSALDLGLGPGDMLRRQQQEDEEERRKRLMQLSRPAGAAYAGGMGQSVTDLFGLGRA